METIFLQISIALFAVLIISFIIRLLKQPLIIGYILTGIIIGQLFFNLLPQNNIMSAFSEFGVAFLLFIVGISLSPKVIKEVGKISLITGIGQVVFTTIAGYFICLLLGFNSVTSLYIAVALTFSSTIIIMKLLSDKDSLDKLYGKISIGFLLVQDLIAIVILIVISSVSRGEGLTTILFSTLLWGCASFIVLGLISYFILPRLNNFFSKSKEFLFVFALCWGLGISSLFSYIGLSMEIGALIAGIMLSISPYSYEISSKLKPLRDFFIICFFILLGSQMTFSQIENFILPIIVFSIFILVGNPLIMMILMGLFGYSKNTSFMTGLTVAQISEFSLILIALGVKLGHLTPEIRSVVTLVGLITIAGSTYLILYSELIYSKISRYLSIFERKSIKEGKLKSKEYECILFGENRIGFSIMNSFIKSKKEYLIVDFNPERVKRLKKRGIDCIYGDVSDIEFLEELKAHKAKLIVSTIPELETNLMLVNSIREKNKGNVIIVAGRQISDAFSLYKAGADYVVLPHFLGGEYTSEIIERAGYSKKEYSEEKNKQLKDLKARMSDGQEHPEVEKER